MTKTTIMKRFLAFSILLCAVGSATSQVFPQELDNTWEFQEENNKIIVITFDLPDIEGLRYLKVKSKAFVNDRLIPMRSLRGDVGESVKVGKSKQILWSWENDVVEIDGELRFEVIADNPNPVDLSETETAISQSAPPAIPVLKVLGLPLGAGGGLALTGLLSSTGAKSEWSDMAVSDRSTEEYDRLNGKYKTGQYIAIGGGLVIVAGIIWYVKEKMALKSFSSRLELKPGIGQLATVSYTNPNPSTNTGLSLNFKF